MPRDPLITVDGAANVGGRSVRRLHRETHRHINPIGLTQAPVDPRRENVGVAVVPLRKPQDTGVPLTGLSMGMSGDFRVAIAEGATIVRVGSLLFGNR